MTVLANLGCELVSATCVMCGAEIPINWKRKKGGSVHCGKVLCPGCRRTLFVHIRWETGEVRVLPPGKV